MSRATAKREPHRHRFRAGDAVRVAFGVKAFDGTVVSTGPDRDSALVIALDVHDGITDPMVASFSAHNVTPAHPANV